MALNPGDNLNMTPSPSQVALATNYIDFTGGADATGINDWRQQYLPDLMAKEAEVFGNRTVSGFLSQVGAEEAMQADRVVWSEQGRLHLAYIGDLPNAANSQITIDGYAGSGADYTHHGLRVGDTVLVANATTTVVARVAAASPGSTAVVTCEPYGGTELSNVGFANSDAVTVLKIGSEFAKGSNTPYTESNEAKFLSYSNKPVIMRDMFHVSGSDVSQVGWVEVSGEDGASGYMWYLKSEGETRMRFTDNLEMMMLEGVMASGANTVDDVVGVGAGTQGLFDAIKDRGNQTSGITGVNAATDLAEFDTILAEFDSQGAIEENMMFVNRATALAMDDMLASMNSYGAGGTSYGVFDNSEDMALNLGFSGFRRGSYDFYKSDWKYLNDAGTRGAINSRDAAGAIRGCIVPAGVSSVYDQQLGKNMKRPFLHVRYRASKTDDRRFKTWVTGSVGAATSELDAMRVNYLSERCMITQGANNFMLMT